jgi:hypothetical protein
LVAGSHLKAIHLARNAGNLISDKASLFLRIKYNNNIFKITLPYSFPSRISELLVELGEFKKISNVFRGKLDYTYYPKIKLQLPILKKK